MLAFNQFVSDNIKNVKKFFDVIVVSVVALFFGKLFSEISIFRMFHMRKPRSLE